MELSAVFTVIAMVAIMFIVTSVMPGGKLGSQAGFAKIKLGPNVTDIRGSFKEVVYSIAKGGINYIRSKAANAFSPLSTNQKNVRDVLQISAQLWFTTLTDGQRTGWDEMAQRLALLDTEDGGGVNNMVPAIGLVGSGVNAFVSFRARSARAGLLGSFSNDAPLGEDQPSIPTIVAPIYDEVTGTLTTSWVDPLVSDASAVIEFWMRSRETTYHKQIRDTIALGVQSSGLNSAKAAKGQNIDFDLAAPQRVIVQLQTVNPSGFGSPGSASAEVDIIVTP